MLQETDEKASARGCDGGQIHRPPGQKLHGDPGAVETDHQGIVVLDMPLLDTRQKAEDLTGTFIADLVLQILCYVAQVERENIRQRQAEGIAAARARGVRFGREKKPVPDGFEDLRGRYRRREITARAAAGQLGVVHSTFLKWGRMAESGLPKD